LLLARVPGARDNAEKQRCLLGAQSCSKRSRDTDALLRSLGWRVLHFWEHQDPMIVAAEVVDAVERAKTARTKGR